MIKRIINFFKSIFKFFLKGRGLFGTKGFIALTQYWPVTFVILFGSYFYSGDRRPLGQYIWVWTVGRAVIVFLSLLCLFFRNWAKVREYLGLSIVTYMAAAITAYCYAVPNHDKLFRGEVSRIFASSMAFFFLALLSYRFIEENNYKRTMRARGFETSE